MRIGIDIRPLMTSERTGVGSYTEELLAAIFTTDQANEYVLFYNASRDVRTFLPEWKFPNVRIVGTHWPNKVFNAATALFDRPRIDRLIEHATGTATHLDLFFSPNLNFTALSPNIPHILTVHDLFFVPFPETLSFKQRLWHHAIRAKRACEQAQHLIVPSTNTKRDLVNWFEIPEQQITVIYPGLSRDFNNYLSHDQAAHEEQQKIIRQRYQLPEHYLLYVGALEKRKNILTILKGFAEFCRRNPAYHLVLAGPSGNSEREFKTFLANNPDVAPRVQRLGYVAAADKPALYQAATVLLYPSLYEGFGFPVLEAMSVATPVITSLRASLGEVGGAAAYYVNPRKPTEIAMALERFINDPELRQRLRSQGKVLAQKFSWQRAAREWLAVIHSTS